MSRKQSTVTNKGKIKPQSKARFGKNQIDMLRSVIVFTQSVSNTHITQSIPAFAATMAEIKSNMAAIDSLSQIISRNITGFAYQKQNLRKALINTSNAIMQSAYSYAVRTNDAVLAGILSTTPSKMRNMSSRNFISFVQGAIDNIKPIVNNLSDYGITTSVLTQWQQSIDNFKSIIPDPNNAIVNRKGAIEEKQIILRQTMLILYHQADAIAQQFRSSQSQYYAGYIAARKLKPVGHVSTQLRATVQNELGQPIANAEIQISDTDLKAISNEKGYASVSHIPFGSHNVTIINGDRSKTFGPFRFKKGQSQTHHFTVAPAINLQDNTPLQTPIPLLPFSAPENFDK